MSLQRLLMLPISLTPLILAALIWNLSVDTSNSRSGDISASDNLPEALVEGLIYSQFNMNGNLIQQLHTDRAVSLIAGAEIELLRPRLWVSSGVDTEWTASSASGYLDRPGSQLVLDGDVVLRRLGDQPAELITDSLTWLPATASAYTNDLVVIDSAGNHIESQGISIDLDRSSFIFHSNVRGTHAPY
jgi:LPS export ABC transporter protein LptC